MAKTVRLEEGVAVEYGSRGERVRSYGADFVSVATDGYGTVAGVTKNGIVIVYRDGLQQFQRSRNAVSVQVSGGHIFVLQDDGVTVEYDSNGASVRNIGVPNQKTKSSQENSQESRSNNDNDNSLPDGLMAGLAYRCKEVVGTPINGPWANICAVLAVACGIFAGILIHNVAPTSLENWQHVVLVVGSAVAIAGLGYWLRHAFAKCFVRSWYGAPALLLASTIYSVDPQYGIWAIAAAILLWFWPIWPLMVVVAAVVIVVLAAAGKSSKRN